MMIMFEVKKATLLFLTFFKLTQAVDGFMMSLHIVMYYHSTFVECPQLHAICLSHS